MSVENIIQAKELFEIKKETGLKDLRSISDFAEYGDEGQQITRDLMITLMQIVVNDYDFDPNDPEFLDEMAFLDTIIQAVVDRNVGIKNR